MSKLCRHFRQDRRFYSMQKMYNILLLASLFYIYIRCEECDKHGVLLYEDLGCRPQKTEGKPCPTHFECDEFSRSDTGCSFKTQNVSLKEIIDDTLIHSACKTGCKCLLPENLTTAEFSCEILECEETWEGGNNLKPGCYYTYSVDECCATGQKCPPYDNIKCKVDGVEYKNGEKFIPSKQCSNCVCQKGFQGKFEAPFCSRIICAEQATTNISKLADNCAPVYRSVEGQETLCCPAEWICPSETGKIESIGTESDPNLECKWGNQLLKLGKGFKTNIRYYEEDSRDFTCNCTLPPFLTCKESVKNFIPTTSAPHGSGREGATPRLEIVMTIILATVIINFY